MIFFNYDRFVILTLLLVRKMSSLFKIFNPALILRRNIKKRYNWYDEGIQYTGFKYYPRYKDFKDPPYEPSKLFRVQRIKVLKGVPYYEKSILQEFKLDGPLNCYAVIKNIPENNARLYRIKHLIKISPITFPDGFPKEDDLTFLKENGELRITKKVALDDRLQLAEAFEKDVKKLDGETLKRESRLRWLSGWD